MDVLTAIKERRSATFFDPDKKIPENTLKELLEISNTAPSSMNLQPWKVVAVLSDDMKEKLMSVAFGQTKVKEASVNFVIVADPKALEENIDNMLKSWVELGYIPKEGVENYRGMAYNLYNGVDSEKRRFFAVKNSSFFAMNLMIAARGLGLETHPIDGFDEAGVKKLLGLPDYVIIPVIIVCGYKKQDAKLFPRAFRRKVEDFVTFV
jgi:nitroreductase